MTPPVVVVAVVAATPPTLAALLAFAASRADRFCGLIRRVDSLGDPASRIETTVGRIEDVVVDLRELARLEGQRVA
jgi:hypothetical protein